MDVMSKSGAVPLRVKRRYVDDVTVVPLIVNVFALFVASVLAQVAEAGETETKPLSNTGVKVTVPPVVEGNAASVTVTVNG